MNCARNLQNSQFSVNRHQLQLICGLRLIPKGNLGTFLADGWVDLEYNVIIK